MGTLIGTRISNDIVDYAQCVWDREDGTCAEEFKAARDSWESEETKEEAKKEVSA